MRKTGLTPLRAALAVGVVACLPAAGCGGGGPHASATRLSVSATTAEGLTATLSQDRAFVPVGSAPVFTLTLSNSTAAPVMVQSVSFPGLPVPPPASLSILDAHGHLVWPVSLPAGGGTPVDVSLGPGQSLSETENLNGVLDDAGTFQAVGTFHTSGADTVVGPLAFAIQP